MSNLAIDEIIKQCAIYVGLDEPTGTITTSTDKNIKKLLQFSLQTGKEIRDNYYDTNLKKNHEITLAASDDQYTLPDDFWRMIPGTLWDQSNSWRIFGPISDQDWNAFKHGIVSSLTRKRLRIFGYNPNSGEIYIDPVPGATETISFDYIRKQWFLPQDWAASTSYSSGDLVSSNGNIYSSGSTATSGSTRPTGTTTHDDGTITWTYVSGQLYSDTSQQWLADTDFPIIDDDLITMGTIWRFLRREGLEYQDEKDEYYSELTRRFSRMETSEILSFADSGLYQFVDNFPEGDYG
jgi:hypothetical protein